MGRVQEGALSADRTPTTPPQRPRLVPLGDKPILTKQQQFVLRALADGRTLADVDGISHETARTHAKAAMKRLGVHTSAGAVAEAIRRGLIS